MSPSGRGLSLATGVNLLPKLDDDDTVNLYSGRAVSGVRVNQSFTVLKWS